MIRHWLRPRPLAWSAAFFAILGLVLWSRSIHFGWLLAACAGLLAAAGGLLFDRLSGRRARVATTRGNAPKDAPGPESRNGRSRHPYWMFAALVVVVGALVAAGATRMRIERITHDWPSVQSERGRERADRLDARMNAVLERARQTAREAAAAVRDADGMRPQRLIRLRERSDVAAIAVFTAAGDLAAWAGEHRGPLPRRVRFGDAPIIYSERPLFSYLYVSEAIQGRGGHAVAALMIEAGEPLDGTAVGALAARIGAEAGVHPRFSAGNGSNAIWRLTTNDQVVLHAWFEPVSQSEARAAAIAEGRRILILLAGLAFLLLSIDLLRGRQRGGTPAVLLCAAVLAAAAPLGAVLGLENLFAPALFYTGWPELTLGTILAIMLPLAAVVATRSPRGGRSPPEAEQRESRRGRSPNEPHSAGSPRWIGMRVAAGALVASIALPAGLRLFLNAASPSLLASSGQLWGAAQLGLVLVLATLMGLVLPRAPAARGGLRPGWSLLAGAILCLVGGSAVLLRWRTVGVAEPWLAALWIIPFILFGMGLRSYGGRRGQFVRWLAAGWLAATAVLPQLWVAHMQTRLDTTARELRTLGTRADPFADYLLRRFAAEAVRRDARGEAGTEMLYRAWVASGLAKAGYPVRITLWQAGQRRIELELAGADAGPEYGIGVGSAPSPLIRQLLDRIERTGSPVAAVVQYEPWANQILAVPLAGDRSVSVVVPPRRELERVAALVPLIGERPFTDGRLSLVPAMPGDTLAPNVIHWQPSASGWRGEMLVRYPEGRYHAHYQMRTASFGVLFARGALVFAANLAVLALLWAFGRLGRGDARHPLRHWKRGLGSFRTRVTLALFAFFLLPVGLFGWVAYRALGGEVVRSARTVAEHAVAQAVQAFPRFGGDLTALAEYTGHEVLYYYNGELARASSPEAVDLGVYGAWMSHGIFRSLVTGENVGATEVRQLGARSTDYLVAYRRLRAAGTLAVPISLEASDAAVRQRELAHLILFAVLLGGTLSVALSVAVGRALSRPIGRLRRAALGVGAGRLSERLPEERGGEFGELFASFNRMIERLRQARVQEIRSARVLAWGEMARQVAHEIKNPLTPIKLSVQHLRRARMDRSSDFNEILETNATRILAEIDRLTQISRAFSRYGAPAESEGPPEPVDVRALAAESLTLYRAGDEGIEYGLEAPPDLPMALARADELREVLLNLLENARDAVGKGGRIRVAMHEAADAIVMTVNDDGIGIAADALPHIFEPQFSTRSSGTGLGLAIVRRLVESWGGRVDAESRPGHGTTVRVRMRRTGAGDGAAGR